MNADNQTATPPVNEAGETLVDQGLKILDDASTAHAPLVVDVLGTTADWFVATGQMPEVAEPNARQAAFYTGMQLEELAEKLSAILGSESRIVLLMEAAASDFKGGKLDLATMNALQARPVTILDGDMDLIWVSIGAARAQGADVIGAYSAVNGAKRVGWQEADLTPFVHESLRA